MTNFEKYRDAVLNIVDNEDFVAVVNDGPTKCSYISCSTCKNNETPGNCTANFVKWLYQEYEEKPTLTERQYHFLKSLKEGVRIKFADDFIYMQLFDSTRCLSRSTADKFFSDLPNLEEDTWYEVSDILTWEVKE